MNTLIIYHEDQKELLRKGVEWLFIFLIDLIFTKSTMISVFGALVKIH